MPFIFHIIGEIIANLNIIEPLPVGTPVECLSSTSNPRLLRLKQKTMLYSFIIEYSRGKTMCAADTQLIDLMQQTQGLLRNWK